MEELKLGALIKDTVFTLNKLEAIKLDGKDTFNSKNLRGTYTVEKFEMPDKTHINADIFLVLRYEPEKSFLEIEVKYNIRCTLLQELNRELTSADRTELVASTLSIIDQLVNPITKLMGYPSIPG